MTAGLSSAFRILRPDDEVVPLPYSVVSTEEFENQVQTCDFLFHSGPLSLVPATVHSRTLTFPELYFDAFHPDVVYAWHSDGSLVEGATGPYNSAVALWAWRRGLSISATIGLFNERVFEALGYHNRWNSALARLQSDFASHKHLDSRSFVQPLRRSGCFMHTVNHPSVSAISRMARLLAEQLTPSTPVDSVPLESLMIDSLLNASFVCAVYPSVANALGFAGDFRWKKEDHSVIDLEDFVEDSFSKYEVSQPVSIHCEALSWPIYDSVLEEMCQSQGLSR